MRRVSLFQILVTLIDPFHVGRNFILNPVWSLLTNLYDETLEKTKNGVLSVRDIVLRVIILLIAVIVVLWTAGFMYVVSVSNCYLPS